MQKVIMHPWMFLPNFRCGKGGSRPQGSVYELMSSYLYISSFMTRPSCLSKNWPWLTYALIPNWRSDYGIFTVFGLTLNE